MQDCIFCEIVSGRAPAVKEYEDDEVIVIPDIHPQAPLHLLFISKMHGEELATVDSAKLTRMLDRVRSEIAQRGLAASSYRVTLNGAAATLVKNHLHIHLLGSVSRKRPV